MQDIKGKIFDVTRQITKTSTEIFKSTKLSVNLSNEESNLKNQYTEIGKKVHEIYAYGGSLGKFFDEKYKEIVEIETRINLLREQLDIAKGTRSCPKCFKNVPRSSAFCPKCGYNIGEANETFQKDIYLETNEAHQENFQNPQSIQSEVVDIIEEKSPTFKTCRSCHEVNSYSEKFCLRCGRML